MIRSRRILAAAAFAALAAWANVQAMACCVVTPDATASVATEAAVPAAEAPMAADHSCCPGAESSDVADAGTPATAAAETESSTDMPGCGMESDGTAVLCCESGEVAAVSAKTVTSFDAGLEVASTASARLPFVSAPPFDRLSVLSSPPDGTPPFLSFQRLLI